ncbi:MAG: HD domain-containing protein [Candidatus Omnitrophica bacterium]|jgi:poly(A) polymerase|nr:HD domain-containing protein [Candidatus Omnitrophota bacterium]
MNLKILSKKIPYFNLIGRISAKHKTSIWLVGGVLRDLFLKRKKDLTDFDFCVEKKVLSIVKEFSKKTSSKFIVLDEEEGSYRVILKKHSKIYTYDFTLMRGRTFLEDLYLRDFTINMLAVNVRNKENHIIDIFGSRDDLKNKLIRTADSDVLRQDPLRILRGFSFMVNYGFKIDKNTQKAFAKFKKLLKNVSGERINEELFKIFACPHSYDAIKRMEELRIIDEIIPQISKTRNVHQGGFHHLDVWRHSLEALREFELLYRKYLVYKKEIFEYLNEPLAENRTRTQIIKIACLLHDIGKPIAKNKKGNRTIFHTHEKIGRDLAEKISKKIKLSLREKEVLKKLIFWHLRPGYLADQAPPTKRAIYHFFRDTQEEGISVILLSLSDWRATRGPLTNLVKRKKHERVMFKLIDHYLVEKEKKPLPKLIDGYDVMKKFNLTPGALIGEILNKVKEEQALSKVKTKSDAYRVAKHIIAGTKHKKLSKGA